MIVAGFAIEADVALHLSARRIHVSRRTAFRAAIAEAYERHYLGKNILGSRLQPELHLHLSGGRYMCGEETGLLNALEGKRANPRCEAAVPAGGGTVRQTHGGQ